MNKIFIFFSILVFLCSAVSSYALEMTFGGQRVKTERCRCGSPAQYVLTIQDFATNKTLKLTYIPGVSILYSSFNLLSAQYLLGTYNPTIRGMCFVRKSGDCRLVLDDGALGSFPGTGFSQ